MGPRSLHWVGVLVCLALIPELSWSIRGKRQFFQTFHPGAIHQNVPRITNLHDPNFVRNPFLIPSSFPIGFNSLSGFTYPYHFGAPNHFNSFTGNNQFRFLTKRSAESSPLKNDLETAKLNEGEVSPFSVVDGFNNFLPIVPRHKRMEEDQLGLDTTSPCACGIIRQSLPDPNCPCDLTDSTLNQINENLSASVETTEAGLSECNCETISSIRSANIQDQGCDCNNSSPVQVEEAVPIDTSQCNCGLEDSQSLPDGCTCNQNSPEVMMMITDGLADANDQCNCDIRNDGCTCEIPDATNPVVNVEVEPSQCNCDQNSNIRNNLLGDETSNDGCTCEVPDATNPVVDVEVEPSQCNCDQNSNIRNNLSEDETSNDGCTCEVPDATIPDVDGELEPDVITTPVEVDPNLCNCLGNSADSGSNQGNQGCVCDDISQILNVEVEKEEILPNPTFPTTFNQKPGYFYSDCDCSDITLSKDCACNLDVDPEGFPTYLDQAIPILPTIRVETATEEDIPIIQPVMRSSSPLVRDASDLKKVLDGLVGAQQNSAKFYVKSPSGETMPIDFQQFFNQDQLHSNLHQSNQNTYIPEYQTIGFSHDWPSSTNVYGSFESIPKWNSHSFHNSDFSGHRYVRSPQFGPGFGNFGRPTPKPERLIISDPNELLPGDPSLNTGSRPSAVPNFVGTNQIQSPIVQPIQTIITTLPAQPLPTAIQVVTMNDLILPVIVQPTGTSISTPSLAQSLPAAIQAVTMNDLIPPVTVQTTGTTSSQSLPAAIQTVTMNDLIPPVIVQPSGTSISTSSAQPLPAAIQTVTATDLLPPGIDQTTTTILVASSPAQVMPVGSQTATVPNLTPKPIKPSKVINSPSVASTVTVQPQPNLPQPSVNKKSFVVASNPNPTSVPITRGSIVTQGTRAPVTQKATLRPSLPLKSIVSSPPKKSFANLIREFFGRHTSQGVKVNQGLKISSFDAVPVTTQKIQSFSPRFLPRVVVSQPHLNMDVIQMDMMSQFLYTPKYYYTSMEMKRRPFFYMYNPDQFDYFKMR